MDVAGLKSSDIDGVGLSSFTMPPDHVIDLTWRLGITADWIADDSNGGAAGVNLLRAATRAIESGDASTILLVAGDRYRRRDFDDFTDHYNKAVRDLLAPIPLDGPNTLFSFVTQRHMNQHGLDRPDYGQVSVNQRAWAESNPLACYRTPMTMEDYLGAPPVAPPLGLYDCVPIVSGADAVIVSTADRLPDVPGVRVGPFVARYNYDHQQGDGTRTALADLADGLYERAGFGPEDIELLSVYDDYPVMVLTQLADLGFAPDGDVQRMIDRMYVERRFPINTSGGMLSAGQAGGGAALHGIVEAVTQLQGRATGRQVSVRNALVTGYGMVVFRYGGCANAVILEAP